MIKEKMHYDNKNIKYKVIMKHDDYGNFSVILKTKLGRFTLINDELVLDRVCKRNKQITIAELYIDDYEFRKNEFLNKWNSYSSKEIKDIAEEFIKNQMDKDKQEYDVNWISYKCVDDFNHKGNYYESDIPKAPREIPMPECKENIQTINTIEYSSFDGILYERNLIWKVSKKEGEN